jgi:hypothetical protein
MWPEDQEDVQAHLERVSLEQTLAIFEAIILPVLLQSIRLRVKDPLGIEACLAHPR